MLKCYKVRWGAVGIIGLSSLGVGSVWAAANTVPVQSETTHVASTATQPDAPSWPLPAAAVREELAQQLLELAIADVNPRFGELWLALAADKPVAQQPQLYADIYASLHHFRERWAHLSWDARERLQLKAADITPVAADYQAYRTLLAASDPGREVQALRPGQADYLALRRQLIQLLDIARQNTWPTLPDMKLKPNEEHEAVPLIADILQRWGLLTESVSGTRYDGALVEAVKQFQLQHGLLNDGIIGRQTLNWLRVPPEQKAVILARAMLRRDTAEQLHADRYVLVNLPGYQLELMDGNRPVLTSRVIVGQLKRQTPIMASQISSIVLNPAWHVPTKILQQDIVPKLAKDPSLLAKEGFDIIDSAGGTVDPSSIAMDEAISSGFPYRLRQQPGTHNALGLYKFYLPNDESIYLHSTSHPALFNNDRRAISSGCVRVEQAAGLAEMLLQGSAWGPERVQKVLQSKETKWVPLKQPVPVYMVYWRSWLDADGKLQFRDDIYGFDRDKESGSRKVMHSLIQRNKA